MTVQEITAARTRQLEKIHALAHTVWRSRARKQQAQRDIPDPRPEADNDGLIGFVVAVTVLALLCADACLSGPALVDRLGHFGLVPEAAWVLAIALAALVMCVEMLIALMLFRAYQRSLTTCRYFGVAFWVLAGILMLAVTVSLSYSQLMLVTGGDTADMARFAKEIALLTLLGAAHTVVLGSGRYLERAKTEAWEFCRMAYARWRVRSASSAENKAHDRLAEEYRRHLMSVKAWRTGGFGEIELGPFEDRALLLIRERHHSVDECMSALIADGGGPGRGSQPASALRACAAGAEAAS